MSDETDDETTYYRGRDGEDLHDALWREVRERLDRGERLPVVTNPGGRIIGYVDGMSVPLDPQRETTLHVSTSEDPGFSERFYGHVGPVSIRGQDIEPFDHLLGDWKLATPHPRIRWWQLIARYRFWCLERRIRRQHESRW